jgi:hypothetical protein
MLLKPDVVERPYSLVRWVLGLYLAVHFAQLVPWGPELFSSQGVLPDASLSPLARFPNLLAAWDAPALVTAMLVVATVAGLALAVGLHDRIAAVLLWYIGACLFGRNPLIANPAMPYVGWMLLAHACLPRQPSRADGGNARSSVLPADMRAAAWILLALGYTYSGFTKLASPSWLDGTAVARVLDTPLARPGALRDLLLLLPTGCLQLVTWGTLGLELAFAPLALLPRLRPLLWTAALGLHAVLLVLLDFADLTLGMIVFHLFTFDPAWVTASAVFRATTGPAPTNVRITLPSTTALEEY